MRQIKFRFFTPDKIMLYEHDGWVENIGINEALNCSKDYGYKIMQFTGLKDKNGKEIYEGDIVKRNGSIYVMIYSDQIAGYTYSRDGINSDSFPVYYDSEMGEVIGNIYENPEQLV